MNRAPIAIFAEHKSKYGNAPSNAALDKDQQPAIRGKQSDNTEEIRIIIPLYMI
jgi:hypothetical protein